MTTSVNDVRETARAAVRSFADFYKANTTLINALPNAAELNAMRIELLSLIARVSADIETAAASPEAEQARQAMRVADEVATMIETLRSRRAELEHWLGKTSGKGMLVLLGLLALGGVGVWYAKKNGMLGGLAEEDCGCG